MRPPCGVALSLAVLLFAQAGQAQPAERRAVSLPDDLPPGVSQVLWKLSVPADLAPTPERVLLGEKLFNDQRLSVDNTVSCSTCHDARFGFTDAKPVSEGVKGQKVTRNSPTLLNALFNASQFWDGRASTLEDQAKLPILNPREMGMPDEAAVVAKVKAIPEYVRDFQNVFGREVNFDDLAAAIAAFERTLYSGDAKFDRFITGDSRAFTAAERRGWALFNGKARCNTCHAGNVVSPLFSDQKFHNIGIAAHKQDFVKLAREALKVVRTGDAQQIDELALETRFSELGRFLVTKQENDVGAFKTPTLRNIAITGPYMHDGTLTTLWDVMDHYNKGGVPNPYLDGGMQRLGLTEAEIDDVVAFLFTLTDARFAKYAAKEQARQRRLKHKRPERDTAVAMGKSGNLGDLAPNPDLSVKNPADIGVYGTETLVKPASTSRP
ncbi:cytochrome-c peroxidase [Corallococcus macrosporus]|uniref:Cytochrome-c peroxidase n=1 Tax=Corallococcus macrosporus DSM 14697 TaxID=1189310 RepID=A0A250K476_9BACT|nr:cytochrome c peroxidase [Corallococcus macrosporus]ATB50855.1 cytochrome-c peroxidase [Corallococcus macrosporus DSM 14697]